MKAWIVIPARGGSVGVPRKNIRMIAGMPLIAYSITAALKVIPREQVVVITDDDEIEEIAYTYSANVIREPDVATGARTLDEVIISYLPQLKAMGASEHDIVLTVQPTAPLMDPSRITEAMAAFESGAGSVITVKDDRHLTWTEINSKPVPEYRDRVNRQLLPPRWRETGAIIGASIADIEKHQTRIVEPIELIKVTEKESLDIDTFADLTVAEHWLSRKKILFRADSSETMGMGHVYRVLALAQVLARHELLIVLNSENPLGQAFFDEQVFASVSVSDELAFLEQAKNFDADLVVLDILDTTIEQVMAIKQALPDAKIVSFEDLGDGATAADLVVSDLYENPRVDSNRQLTGIENAVIAPSFETIERRAPLRETVSEILVLFGGTDPAGLAEKSLRALEAIGFAGKVTVVRGMGAYELSAKDFRLDIDIKRNVKNIAKLMARADLALSSAGRTITELASIGVPILCMAQNQKELMHTHTTPQQGVIMLGLGEMVDDESLKQHLGELIANSELREQLQRKALSATAQRSNEKIVQRIFGKLFGQ